MTLNTLSRAVLTVAIVLVGVQSARAQAQTQTFMLVPGISGDSTAEGYKTWIDVYAITHALAAAAKGTACAVDVAKGIDSAGPRLWAAAMSAQVFAQVQIDIRKIGGDDPFKFYEILLVNARVNSITTMADQFSERLTLTADAITVKFIGQNEQGQPLPAVVTTVPCK